MKTFPAYFVIPSFLLCACSASDNGVPKQSNEIQPVQTDTVSHTGSTMIDLLAKESDDNIVISQLSVDLAMSMLLEGADGTTAQELEKFLGISKADVAQETQKTMASLRTVDDNTQVLIANSFWVQDGVSINTEYEKALKESFDAEINTVDFTKSSAAGAINSWVDEHTNHLIPSVIAPPTDDYVNVLVNTLYFKSQWLASYWGSEQATLHGINGDTEAEMLSSTEDTYFENDAAVGFAKPYIGPYEFIGILPKAEGSFTLSDLDIEGLLETRNENYDVHTRMPKLDVSYAAGLNGVLQAMGLQSMFQAGKADFSGIMPDMFVDQVLQKTKLILDENGTEAAAATAVVASATAIMEPKQEKTVILDRPYAFLIRNTETGAVLFTGKIIQIN